MDGAIPINDFNDANLASFIERHEQFKMLEEHKLAFDEELIAHLRLVTSQLSRERADNVALNNMIQVARDNIAQLETILDADPFVLVLIDGNNVVFHDSFFQDSEIGGRRAARKLHQITNEYVFASINHLPPETKVVARIYLDADQIGESCSSDGMPNAWAKVKGFLRGFCQDKASFDIVNVGSGGKEAVVDKIEEQLKLHGSNPQCRQILLGCSDESIYSQMLRELAISERFQNRVTLLSGDPHDQELDSLPFPSTRMDSIFRDVKEDAPAHAGVLEEIEPFPPPITRSAFEAGGISPPKLSTRGNSRSDGMISSPVDQAPIPLTTQSSPPKPMSWAHAVKQVAPALTTRSQPEPPTTPVQQKAAPIIRRNKHGHRIDPPTPEYKKDEVNRLKAMKLCNPHYLLGGCEYPDSKCTHDHYYKPKKSELETLKLIARMACCNFGSECDDPACIYGHRCPFPQAKVGSMRGKGCINNENCRFPSHMHAMDTVPVKRTRVT